MSYVGYVVRTKQGAVTLRASLTEALVLGDFANVRVNIHVDNLLLTLLAVTSGFSKLKIFGYSGISAFQK